MTPARARRPRGPSLSFPLWRQLVSFGPIPACGPPSRPRQTRAVGMFGCLYDLLEHLTMLSIVQRALDNTEPAHSVDTSAVPPVRLLELAQAYEDNNGRWPTRRLRVPAASDACYTIHGESGGHTPSPSDNLAINCHDSGYDLSATIHHRWGQPAPLGTTYTIDCPALE